MRLRPFALSLLLLSPALAEAQTPTASEQLACQMRTSGLAESYLHPPNGGDEDFFVTHGGIPNVLFILDTSRWMRDLPFWPATNGCNDSRYGALGFDSLTQYPAYDPDGNDGAFEQSNERAYVFDVTDPMRFTGVSTEVDSALACSKLNDEVKRGSCGNCVRTSGYYREGNFFVASGNFLNFFPPKYAMARKSLKKVLVEVRRIRMGIMGLEDPGGFWIKASGLNPACNMSWPPKDNSFDSNRASMINALNHLDLGDFEANASVAEALFQAGQVHTNQAAEYLAVWPFLKTYPIYDSDFDGAAAGGNQETVCWPCQFNSVILVGGTDPYGDTQVPAEIMNLDGSVDPRLDCPECGYDGLYSWGTRPNSVHKVAYWMNGFDFRADLDGQQGVNTYTVGFLADSPLLRRTAELGGGLYRIAESEDGLTEAVQELLFIISDRANAFVSASFAGVQSQATQSILVPRFRPSKDLPWEGRLYRFDFVSEFVANVDLDGDGEKQSFFLIDKGCEGVTDWANPPADCRPLRSAEHYDLALQPDLRLGDLYRQTSFEDETLTEDRGVPFWEAGERLNAMGPATRRIYTAAPDASLTTETQWSLLAFTEANAAALAPLMGLTTSSVCEDVYSAAGLVYTDADTPTDCAKLVIRYVRGCEAGDPAAACVPRAHLLADIFHSAPVVVEPPTPRNLLATAFRDDQSMTALAPAADPVDVAYTERDGKMVHPYESFSLSYLYRDRVALVGSNGGMLHAFHAGGWDATARSWTRGTGQELWAFIPPDLLPKLPRFLTQQRHEIFVDGSPWVRNVWVDGLGTQAHVREVGEYRTVAIVGEREGGNRYFALDVTNAHRDVGGSPLTSAGSGQPDLKMLWSFPQIGSPEVSGVGQTWSDMTPLPPPIGPIRIQSEDETGVEYRGVDVEERWVVALPGGYDSTHTRGRGWGLLDAYTGALIWEVSYNPVDDIRKYMTHAIAAPPVMTAWGRTPRWSKEQPYFDTLLVGDTAGQVWVGYFNDPNPANWTVARVFQERKSEDATDVPWRNPFFQAATLVPLEESGFLRAYLGTGDRAHLVEKGAGNCSIHNLTACMRAGCTLESVKHKAEVGTSSAEISWSYTPGTGWQPGSWSPAGGSDACGLLHVDQTVELSCPGLTPNQITIDSGDAEALSDSTLYTARAHLRCEQVDGELDCSGVPQEPGRLPMDCVDQTGWPHNRFYSLRIFGGDLTPELLESDPVTFDQKRLTVGSEPATEVVDAGSAEVRTDSMGAGWYYEYAGLSERTVTPSVTSSACVVWSSIETDDVAGCTADDDWPDSPCAGGGDQQAWMYFRNYIDGKMGCIQPEPDALGWDSANDRQDMGDKPQPPAPPQVVVQIGTEGATQVSVVTAEGGDVSLGMGEDILQEFDTLLVPGDLHDWRHAACTDQATGDWICE